MTPRWPMLLALGVILTMAGPPPPLAAGPTREEALTALADAGDAIAATASWPSERPG